MRRILQATLAAVIAAVGAGCTTVYTPAPGEPTARLRLVASHMPMYGNESERHRAHLFVRDLSACPAEPVIASAGNEIENRAMSLHMPAPPDAADRFHTELLIPADKLLGLVVSGADAGGHWLCEAQTRFRPVAGVDYEVEQRWSADDKKCFLEMHTLAADDRGVARRKPFVPLDPDTYGLAWTTLVIPVSRSVIVVTEMRQQRLPDLCELPAR